MLTATCRRKPSHGILAGGCDVENDTDHCEVKIRCGMDSVICGKSRSQSVSRTVRHVRGGSVDSWYRDGAHVSCDFLIPLLVTLW